MHFIFARACAIALALAALPVSPALAQDKPASAASTHNYLGRWTGQTDWHGIEGYDAANAWWEFRADGTFVDNSGETGRWSVGTDGYVTFTYQGGGNSRYTGTIVGGTLLGTMTNGSSNGVFALRR